MSDLGKTGLGLIWQEMLENEGYHSLADLAAATDETLLVIPGIGPFKLRMIRRVAPYQEVSPVEEKPDALSALSD